jgi:phosphatidylinositol alpha-mannosyltransferase
MKIALVCPYNMFERAGGVQQQVIHLHDELKKRGHGVKIITPKPVGFDGEVPEDYILLGSSTNFNPFNSGMATSGTWSFDADADTVKNILDKEKFDVLHFHEPWAPILGRQILQYSPAAHVGTFHANLVDSLAAKSIVNAFGPYGRGIASKMHLMTAVSPAPAAMFINKQPDNELVKNIKYIPNGINLKRYQTKPASAIKHPDMKTVLYVGRLEGRKGVKYLLSAYAQLAQRNENVQLLIAGIGPDEDKLREFVSENKIPRVTFMGFISDKDKIHYLHRSDVFCSPATRGESFGIVLLEAMAAGCPIVAGDNIGYQSVMKDTGAISLVNPKDTVDFARRLEIMLFSQDLRTVWLKWAQKSVKQYDFPKVVDQYEAAYKEAIAIHGQQPKAKRRFSLRRQPR